MSHSSSHRLIGSFCTLLASGLLLGCSTTGTHHASAAPVVPKVNPEARAILAHKALSYDGQTPVLGAGDAYGARIHRYHVATVRAEHHLLQLEAMLALRAE